MLTPLQEIERRTAEAIRQATGVDADPAVAPSQNPQFGDYQSNAAMPLAGRLGSEGKKLNPRALAEQITALLDACDFLAAPPTVAGPGFINFSLSPAWVAARATEALRAANLGVPPAEGQQRVVVEYSSPNIAKQMHVGHIRSTILGDAAARVLEFLGHEVIRQNHVGDWGTQFGRVILALWYIAAGRRYRMSYVLRGIRDQAKTRRLKEHPDEAEVLTACLAEVHRFLYRKDPTGKEVFLKYLKRLDLKLPELESWYGFVSSLTETDAAAHQHADPGGKHTLESLPREITRMLQRWEDPQNEQERIAWEKARDVTMRACQDIYDRLGVGLTESDVRGESFYDRELKMLRPLVDSLLDARVLERSEGAVVSTHGGFEAPLIVEKSIERTSAGGGFGYGTTDLAAALYRARDLGATRVIYFVDARQSQHFQQVFATYRAAADRAGWPREVSLEHARFGMVLGDEGTPLKTREGGTIKLADLLDEAERRARAVVDQQSAQLPEEEKAALAKAVGIGAVKYADLSKDRTSDYVFSYDQMLSLDGNTAPYLQYAHARVQSIGRKAAEQGIASSTEVVELREPAELALAKHLISFGDTVRAVARELKPHLLCAYLYEAARRFSVFYENCPVLRSEGVVRSSRLALTDLTGRTLATGLDLLGIAHPERM